MNIFNSIRMRSYLEHLVVGVAVFFVGAGILYGIIEEMVTSYLPESRYAYICGIIASGAMVLCGIVFIFRAFYMDKKIFVHLNTEERQLFFKELNDATTMIFGHRLIFTQHFILIYARKFKSFIHLWKLDDLTACYGKAIYSEGVQKPDGYRLVISDERFEPMVCMIKGEAALVMDEAYRAIISLAPWVFTDNFEEFEEEITYTIVGPAEADPAELKLSNESPLGMALMGHAVGDVVENNAPDGVLKFKILNIQ